MQDGDRGGNEATTPRERRHGARKRHRKLRIGEMPVHKIKFVLVNNMAPRNPSVCAECLRPLERGYFTRSFHLKALLRDRVLPPMDGGKWIRRIGRPNESIRARSCLAEADR